MSLIQIPTSQGEYHHLYINHYSVRTGSELSERCFITNPIVNSLYHLRQKVLYNVLIKNFAPQHFLTLTIDEDNYEEQCQNHSLSETMRKYNTNIRNWLHRNDFYYKYVFRIERGTRNTKRLHIHMLIESNADLLELPEIMMSKWHFCQWETQDHPYECIKDNPEKIAVYLSKYMSKTKPNLKKMEDQGCCQTKIDVKCNLWATSRDLLPVPPILKVKFIPETRQNVLTTKNSWSCPSSNPIDQFQANMALPRENWIKKAVHYTECAILKAQCHQTEWWKPIMIQGDLYHEKRELFEDIYKKTGLLNLSSAEQKKFLDYVDPTILFDTELSVKQIESIIKYFFEDLYNLDEIWEKSRQFDKWFNKRKLSEKRKEKMINEEAVKENSKQEFDYPRHLDVILSLTPEACVSPPLKNGHEDSPMQFSPRSKLIRRYSKWMIPSNVYHSPLFVSRYLLQWSSKRAAFRKYRRISCPVLPN